MDTIWIESPKPNLIDVKHLDAGYIGCAIHHSTITAGGNKGVQMWESIPVSGGKGRFCASSKPGVASNEAVEWVKECFYRRDPAYVPRDFDAPPPPVHESLFNKVVKSIFISLSLPVIGAALCALGIVIFGVGVLSGGILGVLGCFAVGIDLLSYGCNMFALWAEYIENTWA